RANADGSMLRLKDVARVEFGAATYNGDVRIGGKPGINIGIFQTAGSNANELQIAVAKDFRSTLIPAIAVPVAIVGTFFFMQLVGFSINLLTLFALVLAIGIVVDDAIVVVEAVHSKLEEGAQS
nr:hypothetical protein [Tanacetum cinerariifolium]